MKRTTATFGFIAILLTLLLGFTPAFSASNHELEERIEKLERRTGGGSGHSDDSPLGKISEWVTISGLIEAEVGFESIDHSDGSEEDNSDVTLATVELGIEAKPLDWTTGFILFLYEEDDDDLNVDEGHVTLGATDDTPYYLTIGKLYVPFGAFETMMISDPITLDMGETNDAAVQIGLEMNGFRGAAYVFNGDADDVDDDDDAIEVFGLSVGYTIENDSFSVDLGADWINNILDSDGLNDVYDDNGWAAVLGDQVPGVAIHAMGSFGPFTLIGEYVTMTDDVEDTTGAFLADEASAFAIEAGYTFDISGFETTIAIGYQASDDAAGILPEDKILGSVGVGITDNLSIAAEYATAEDYSVADGGSGEDIDSLTFQLAFEF